MSTLTGKDLNLVKPALTDDHKVTIGTDLPANFQKIDDEFTAHLADDAKHLTTDAQTILGNKTLSGTTIASGLLNYCWARKTNGGGSSIFPYSYSLIILYAVDKITPANYIVAIGYKGLQNTDTHSLTVLHSNVLSLGAKNANGTQVISGGTAANIIAYGISIPV